MFLIREELLRFGGCTKSSRNFIKGQELYDAKHILKCGKIDGESKYNLLAFCIRAHGSKNKPCEIKGSIAEDGRVVSMVCNCTAGASEKCKHIMCLLFYLEVNDLDTLEVLSCTDQECYWKAPYQALLKNYEAAPLVKHECYSGLLKKTQQIVISSEVQQKIREKLFANKLSALSKHVVGRHAPLHLDEPEISMEPSAVAGMLCITFNEKSSYLIKLSQIPVPELSPCCKTFLNRLHRDVLEICVKTKLSKKDWKRERQYRITGSRCYGIHTYLKNKKPDWSSKALKYFYSKEVLTSAMKYGMENEPKALEAYELEKKLKVITCGLVVCKENPWLGYSPDGVIIENNRPAKLLEIKCPVDGKNCTVTELLPKLNLLIKNAEGTYSLKEKHQYYGQVQLGMVMLNVLTTDFIIYASYDNSFHVVNVKLDHEFVVRLLVNLRYAYFEKMIHTVCLQEKLYKPISLDE